MSDLMNPGQTPEHANLLHPTAAVSSDCAHLYHPGQISSPYLSYPLFLYFDSDHPELNTDYSTNFPFAVDYYSYSTQHPSSYLNPPIYDSSLDPRNHFSPIYDIGLLMYQKYRVYHQPYMRLHPSTYQVTPSIHLYHTN